MDNRKQPEAERPSDALDDFEWPLGTRVTKTKGSSWTGKVAGFYSTSLTPEGYVVESENEPNSVQNYPRAALALAELEPPKVDPLVEELRGVVADPEQFAEALRERFTITEKTP